MNKPKILFVCGRNKRRSLTAQTIYKKDTRIEVRSAGTSEKSPHPISRSDILWADLILVMESKYKERIRELFRDIKLASIRSLDIPDEYEYMDGELVDLIKTNTEYHIKLLTSKLGD